jgi:hypothetical protein
VAACAGGRGVSHQRVTRRDKNVRTLELSLSTWPIRDADGRVTANIGIYADIRAEELRLRQGLAEKQLEEVERLYAAAPSALRFHGLRAAVKRGVCVLREDGDRRIACETLAT